MFRKSTSSFTKSSSFVFIGPILNKILPFKNSKIGLRNVWIPSGQVSGNPYNGFILFNVGSIDTKLEDFVKHDVLF